MPCLCVCGDDVEDACVGSDEKGEDGEEADENVAAVVEPGGWLVVRETVYESRHQKTQRRGEQRSHQANDRLKIWHCYGNQYCNKS